MIVVLDTGCANIGSILSMSKKIGVSAIPSSNYKDLKKADKIILPGVGHFDAGMRALKNLELSDCLTDRVLGDNVPVLGICLGMQMMCKASEEGDEMGLSWIDAEVKSFKNKLSDDLKIPHMGWNNVTVVNQNPIIEMNDIISRFYFVHSYYVECKNSNDILLTTNYGFNFTSAFKHNNIFGVQFHPEKSHRFGMTLLKKFLYL